VTDFTGSRPKRAGVLAGAERRTGLALFWALIFLGVLFVVITLPELPPSVATNFNGAGMPHAWMARQSYAIYLAAIGLGLPLLTVALVGRRPGSRAGRWWLGSLMTGFALGIHTLILGAHRTEPPHLSAASLLTVMGLFVAGLVGWAVHWRGGPAPGQSSW
jgi:hypothetical protein